MTAVRGAPSVTHLPNLHSVLTQQIEVFCAESDRSAGARLDDCGLARQDAGVHKSTDDRE